MLKRITREMTDEERAKVRNQADKSLLLTLIRLPAPKESYRLPTPKEPFRLSLWHLIWAVIVWYISLKVSLSIWWETRAEMRANRAWALAQDRVEVIEATVSAAVAIEDVRDDVWFLQVGDDEILVLNELIEDAPTDTLRVVRFLDSDIALDIAWSGDPIEPARPPRRSRYGEVMPESLSVLEGQLDDLDALLLPKTTKHRSRAASRRVLELAELGFFKLAKHVALAEWNDLMRDDWTDFFRATGRLFESSLADGDGAEELLFMDMALRSEGVILGQVTDRLDLDGYRIEVNGVIHMMWSKEEAEQRWALTLERISVLVNHRLIQAGSPERLFVVTDNLIDYLVLMTPAMKAKLEQFDILDETLTIKWHGSSAPTGALSMPAASSNPGALSASAAGQNAGTLSEVSSGPTKPC